MSATPLGLPEALLAYPVLPLLVGALLVALLPRRAGAVVTVLAPVVALWQAVGLRARGGLEGLGYEFYGFELALLRADDLSVLFTIVFSLVAVLAGLYGFATMHREERVSALLTAAAGVGVVLAGDWLSLLIFWEIKAVVTTALILARRTPQAKRAGVRYFVVHFVGGSALLGGVVWLAVSSGSLEVTALAQSPAAWALLVGVGLSAAIPPLHAWLPDAYPEASPAAMVFLSAYTTKAAIYTLARAFPGFEVLLWLGVIMAVYGVTYAMIQDDIRRLLAYHIVSQVGFMVAAVGIGTDEAINGGVAHAFAHILYKGLLLMGTGAVLYAAGRSRGSELGGLARRLPWVLGLYLVGALSISSMPGLSGFVSKELTIEAVHHEHLTIALWLLKIAAVGTFLSTTLKLPYAAFFRHDAHQAETGRPLPLRPIPATMYAAMGLAAVANLAIGVAPGPLLWDLLPHANEYSPFTSYKLAETLSLLAVTGVGFWLWIERLGPKRGTMLDVDWVYRIAPERVAARAAAMAPTLSAGPAVGRALADTRLAGWLRAPAGRVMLPVWALGAVIMAASSLIFVLGVWT